MGTGSALTHRHARPWGLALTQDTATPGMIVAGLKAMPMTASPNFLTLHIVSASFRAKG